MLSAAENQTRSIKKWGTRSEVFTVGNVTALAARFAGRFGFF